MTKLSILDLAPVAEGSTPAAALRNSLDLVQHAEQWGFERYWVAEHHNMKGIASAATSVVIGYLAGKSLARGFSTTLPRWPDLPLRGSLLR